MKLTPSDFDKWHEKQKLLDPLREQMHALEIRLGPWGLCGEYRGFSTHTLKEVKEAFTRSGHADELLLLLEQALALNEEFDIRESRTHHEQSLRNVNTWEDFIKRFPGSQSEGEAKMMRMKHWLLKIRLGYELCPSCNRGIIPGSRFCVYCGGALKPNLTPKRASSKPHQ